MQPATLVVIDLYFYSYIYTIQSNKHMYNTILVYNEDNVL